MRSLKPFHDSNLLGEQLAHNGTYALAGISRWAAHIAGYALPVCCESLGELEPKSRIIRAG